MVPQVVYIAEQGSVVAGMRVKVKGYSREPHFQQWVSSWHCLDLDLSERQSQYLQCRVVV